MKYVNIIMAAYNGGKFIGEQLESILNNDYTNWILWVFDDGSTDETQSIVRKHQIDYPDKIKYIKNSRNLGVTHNFLNGLCYVVNEGDRTNDSYFMFCDQDDVWYSNKIADTVSCMLKLEKKHGRSIPAAVFTDVNVVDSALMTIHPSFHHSNHLDTKKLDLPHLLMENKLIGCTTMINYSLASKVTVKSHMHIRYHDWWIGLIAASCGNIGYLHKATMAYRQHGNNLVGDQNFIGYVEKRILSFKEQRETLLSTVKQAGTFYRMYHKELEPQQKLQIYTFANLYNYNWILRRAVVMKHGYLKSGFLRNLGLLLIL
ncbi:glycosyl transferase [Anaerocolumna cellulosilytica]|uniref:Glycosyl transferase n=1 Tax=Anaerocolumna cellulosilytica TaxID=433286 RepID=A0A6S6QWY5_9FIRM|nr:glycosyltransferase family 2 protein [Anaerocolumna cellulosilytica]MBB5196633.1 glycosyltransferase involved in cell wall biosynthesis [Anaerocolumna cellulosilytica]BCJ95733.1 glycosyl transferase [Anaerocolumna cellulosilytica]